MSRRNRPSAFDISFPDEQVRPGTTSLVERARAAALGSGSHSSNSHASGSGSRSTSTTLRGPSSVPSSSAQSSTQGGSVASSLSEKARGKRVADGGRSDERSSGLRADKRSRVSHDPKPRYNPRDTSDRDVQETATTLIIGEDPEDEGEDGEKKPIRILSEFAVFDPDRALEMVSLDLLDEDEHANGRYQAAGYVAPVFVNEEDAGQEDEDEEEITQRLRTSALLRYSFDFTSADDPLYVETRYAWYILRNPSRAYRSIYQAFYHPLRVAQMVVSSALENPRWKYDDFRDAFIGAYDEFLAKKLDAPMVDSAIPTLKRILSTLEEVATLRKIPLIHDLIGDIPSSAPAARRAPMQRPRPNGRLFSGKGLTGNIDLAVLRRENQNPTHVTPLIDRLAEGLFRERLVIVGPTPRRVNRQQQTARHQRQRRLKLLQYLKVYGKKKKNVLFPGRDQLEDEYWASVVVEEEKYLIGDCAAVKAGAYQGRPEPIVPENPNDLPENASAADYFWFGRIVYIDQQSKQVHLRWFEHASHTVLQEISNPQELFFSGTCTLIDASQLCGKANIMYGRPPPGSSMLDGFDYFCNTQYSDMDGSFTAVPPDVVDDSEPPNNCPVCAIAAQRNAEDFPQEIKGGFAYHGSSYHIHDYVLIQNSSAICDIGQIVDIIWSPHARQGDRDWIKVRALGRVSDIVELNGRPDNMIKDERHLYFTDTVVEVPMRLVIRQCTVVHPTSYASSDFTNYLSLSPYHFYVRYKFPELEVTSWVSKVQLHPRDVLVCNPCCQANLQKLNKLNDFLDVCGRKPLRAFDPFGGVGAFSLGLEQAGCMKTTHAIEISPSATDTLKKNSPDTVVYNQCSNIMLRYAIKSHEGHEVEVPKSLGNQVAAEDPPKPGDIDCIIAGFPCQPHSRLNMFQRADDKKSHLILNLLSWVDFLRPKYCFFENVRGFLKYNLNAVQAGRYRVEGGIEMGGLKWLIYALLDMNYQVRYGLLQAAHYGTPQSRVRFFLIASQQSYPLPALPLPTHEFPVRDALEIKTRGLPRPIAPIKGSTRALYHFINVEDAISDLPRFDWKNPRILNQPSRMIADPDNPGSEINVPVLPCNKNRAFCGYSGAIAAYESRPKTLFQLSCRERPSRDLQHYTRVLKEQVVERVVSIPLQAKADYKTLKPSMWEWQFSNPSSAVARDGFRPGLYGRLDQKGWFHTTVTNVEPTAKQSWVLNPFCKRVVTVRELARSQGFPDHFVFSSVNNDVKTMQRQIGNAVPWPVSVALGRELRDAMMKKWIEDQENTIVIDSD